MSAASLPGFRVAADLVDRQEEARLIDLIEACRPRNYAGDAQGGLRAISFGWHYDLASASFSPCESMPDSLHPLRDVAARFAGVAPQDIVQCLFNCYERGAEIPWHCDKPIWEHVVGISLGGSAVMRFRPSGDAAAPVVEAALVPRSAYLLSGAVRHRFDHSIPPVRERRWSITLRTLSAEGEAFRRHFHPTPRSLAGAACASFDPPGPSMPPIQSSSRRKSGSRAKGRCRL